MISSIVGRNQLTATVVFQLILEEKNHDHSNTYMNIWKNQKTLCIGNVLLQWENSWEKKLFTIFSCLALLIYLLYCGCKRLYKRGLTTTIQHRKSQKTSRRCNSNKYEISKWYSRKIQKTKIHKWKSYWRPEKKWPKDIEILFSKIHKEGTLVAQW